VFIFSSSFTILCYLSPILGAELQLETFYNSWSLSVFASTFWNFIDHCPPLLPYIYRIIIIIITIIIIIIIIIISQGS
jgi:hypothetical protein